MKTKDARKEKIRDLKTAIIAANAEVQEMTTEKDKLEDKDKKKEKETEIMVKKTLIQNMLEELKLVRMNKNSSSFFSYTPTPPNRRMARDFRKRNKRRYAGAIRGR